MGSESSALNRWPVSLILFSSILYCTILSYIMLYYAVLLWIILWLYGWVNVKVDLFHYPKWWFVHTSRYRILIQSLHGCRLFGILYILQNDREWTIKSWNSANRHVTTWTKDSPTQCCQSGIKAIQKVHRCLNGGADPLKHHQREQYQIKSQCGLSWFEFQSHRIHVWYIY
jgi:hypothetical protein